MIGAVGRVGLLGLQSGRRGRLLLYPAYVQDYLDRVTAADVSAGNTQGLELGVTDAFNTCLQAMVGDGSLGVSGNVLAQAASLVKASCAMQGARTLSGALVPLAADMPAPTSVNFVTADYNRRTGLGDPANVSKYLNSNRNNNADLQNSNHRAVFVSSAPTSTASGPNSFPCHIGTGGPAVGSSTFGRLNSNSMNGFTRNNCSSAATITGMGPAILFTGTSRSVAATYSVRHGGNTITVTQTSETPFNGAIGVYRELEGSASAVTYSNARLNFYSIGSALDLAILDARITALSNAIQAAIAP